MEIQEIDVFVQPDGTVKLEVRGVKGPQCVDLTAPVEKLLGGQVLSREKTPEFDQPQAESLDQPLNVGQSG